MTNELRDGFKAGVVYVDGTCEHCHVPLRDGDYAAIWMPTLELFCMKCALAGVLPEPPLPLALVIPAVTAILLLLTVMIGLAD